MGNSHIYKEEFPMEDYEVYSVREVAEKLSIKQQKVLNLIKSAKLKAKKSGWVWLISKEDLEKYQKEQQANQPAEV
jgi:excisionase family DNA binding protein